MNKRSRVASSLALALVALLLLAVPASAAEAEPPVSATAWYWEDQKSESYKDPLGNTHQVSVPNPFCPAPVAGGGSVGPVCNEGRLPVEIHQGDYDTPNKLSAVLFDLSLVPVGSTVSDFTVTFLESKSGCYDSDDPDKEPDKCQQTDPINIEGKKLKACLVGELFGEGEASAYRQIPRHECDGAPVATRKQVKSKDKDGNERVDHVWTFDLTAYAQGWVEEFTTATGIVITGLEPKGQTADEKQQDTWRVVLAGPRFPEGVRSSLSFKAPEGGTVPDPLPPPGDTTTDTGFDTTTGDTGFGATTTTGGDAVATDTPVASDASPAPVEGEAPTDLAGSEVETQGMPGYVWLAILAGLIGFSLVRSAVIEAATGHRPGGVLAQIHRLNAERRGAGAAAAGTSGGPLAALGRSARNGLRPIAGKLGAVGSRIKSFRKG